VDVLRQPVHPKKIVAMEHIDTQRRIGPEAPRAAAPPSEKRIP